MKSRYRMNSFQVVVLVVMSLIAISCGGATDSTTTVAEETTSTASEETTTTAAAEEPVSEPEELIIANVQPFSGANAAYGPEQQAGCVSAAELINLAGAAMGASVECLPVDTRSNPADGVPAVQQLLATEPGLIGVVGPSSDTAAVTIPLLNEAQIPYFPDTGDTRYSQQESDYFWRLAVADDVFGVSLAVWAKMEGYQRVAVMAGNDEGSQMMTPTLLAAIDALGLDLVAEEIVPSGQASYRSEANRVAEADPEVIIIPTTDPQTVSTFLGELFELHEPIPIIGAVAPLQPLFSGAIKAAIGDEAYEDLYVSVHQSGATTGPARDAYQESLLASEDQIDNPSQWAEDPYSMAVYDAVVLMGLAMISAESTDPQVFNSHILDVSQAGGSKTVVATYADGKSALEGGEEIQYVGALGQIAFNQWHNSGGTFIVTRASGDAEEDVGAITGEEISEVLDKL